MDRNNAIELRHLDKSFKTYRDKAHSLKEILIRRPDQGSIHHVLKDISLDIHKGESVALIGTNGSGKSTLLKCMTKILYPNKGTIETNGKVTSLLELGAGFHPDFTGRENIYFNAAVFGMSRREIDERLDEIIAFSELEDFIDEPVRTYSSGMYMRLAFSIAINVDADILLVDEILAVGDQHFQNKCFEKLEELRDSDKTIVIVSHSLDSVKQLCTRAIWLYDGHVRQDGDPAFVISEYLKQSAIDNQEQIKEESKDPNKIRAAINVDCPVAFQTFRQGELIPAQGWCVTSAQDYTIELFLDDTRLPLPEPMEREDVFFIYQEEYAGLLDQQQLGWKLDVSSSDLKPGEHVFSCVLMAGSHQIAARRIRFNIAQ